jgi:hypothetical protein
MEVAEAAVDTAPDNAYDDAFWQRVDRAMNDNKRRDPWRLDQITRAANEELRANPFGDLQ